MRRTNPFVAAAFGAVLVLVVVIALPGLSIGEPSEIHSGTPTEVFTTTETEVCAVITPSSSSGNPERAVRVETTSDLLVYFTSEWSGPDIDSEILLSFVLIDGEGNVVQETPFEWGLASPIRTHDSGTLMWTFGGVPPGDYTVVLSNRLDPVPGPRGGGGRAVAVLENCALTVFVSPSAGPDGQRPAVPIGTGYVELTEEQVAAEGYEVKAFVPTGSLSDGCLVTLAESDFAVWGTTIYCGVRQFDGQDGLYLHIFLGQQAPPDFVFGISVYQPFAQGYGEPVPYTD